MLAAVEGYVAYVSFNLSKEVVLSLGHFISIGVYPLNVVKEVGLRYTSHFL